MHPKGRHQDVHGGRADMALMENTGAIRTEENGEVICPHRVVQA